MHGVGGHTGTHAAQTGGGSSQHSRGAVCVRRHNRTSVAGGGQGGCSHLEVGVCRQHCWDVGLHTVALVDRHSRCAAGALHLCTAPHAQGHSLKTGQPSERCLVTSRLTARHTLSHRTEQQPQTNRRTCTLLQLTSSQEAMTSSNTTPVLWHLSMLMALHLPLTCVGTTSRGAHTRQAGCCISKLASCQGPAAETRPSL